MKEYHIRNLTRKPFYFLGATALALNIGCSRKDESLPYMSPVEKEAVREAVNGRTMEQFSEMNTVESYMELRRTRLTERLLMGEPILIEKLKKNPHVLTEIIECLPEVHKFFDPLYFNSNTMSVIVDEFVMRIPGVEKRVDQSDGRTYYGIPNKK